MNDCISAVLILDYSHSRCLLYHVEQDAGEYQAEDHDEGQTNPCATYDIRVLLQRHRRDIVTPIVVRVVQCLPADTGLPLSPVDLFATRLWHSPLPVPVIVHTAAMQSSLDRVPRIGDDLLTAVQADAGTHLLSHCELHLLPEHVPQDASD